MSKGSITGISIFTVTALALAVVIFNGGSIFQTPVSAKAQKIWVIDGDTFELNSKRIRLFGIDAPEKEQPCIDKNTTFDCGAASREHLRSILSGANVECQKKDIDRWGRIIGLCYADGEDVGQLMVRHGWAVAYRQYSSAYVKDEKFARSNKLGVWATKFTIPSKWRHSNK